jgi:hypothetical protein
MAPVGKEKISTQRRRSGRKESKEAKKDVKTDEKKVTGER